MNLVQLCQEHMIQKRRELLQDDEPVQHPTSYGSLYPKHKFKDNLNKACLGGISSLPSFERQAFYIFHQAKDDETNRRYLSFLLGPESPWRDIIQAQPRQDEDFVFNNGYVLTDFRFASNFFVNFLTAFRLSYEKPYCLLFWQRLLDAGVRPGTALMFTSVCHGFDGQNLHWWNDTGHNAFTLQFADLETVRRVNTGRPSQKMFSSTNFTASSQYAPCNVVWTGHPLYPEAYLNGTLYTEAYLNGNYEKPWGELFQSLQTFIYTKGSMKVPTNTQRFRNPKETSKLWVSPSFEELRDFCLHLDKEYK